jgi:hypothetical protein
MCLKCDYKTDRKLNFTRHCASKLCKEGPKKHHCEKCNMTFIQKGHLEAHLVSNKHLGIVPIVDKKKINQTKSYMNDYLFKYKTNEKAINKILCREIELQGDEKKLDILEKKYETNLQKYNLAKHKYKTLVEGSIRELLKPYFSYTWKAISIWLYNAQ